MDYLCMAFYIFIPIFLTVYYITPKKYKYIVIFFGSYFFYGYSNPKLLVVLILVSFVSYVGGWSIRRSKYSSAVYALFFVCEIAILGVYKYTDFLISNINSILLKMNCLIEIKQHFHFFMPIGLSFIVFQAITYLSDVYRRKMDVETNPIKLGAFVAFFPTVLSGPIQKSRNLIPQISHPARIDYEQMQKAILLFVWGVYEKTVVANKLMEISTTIIGDYLNRSSAEILIGAVSFSVCIYADFSAYSDMARGIGKALGIDVGRNFSNPYLATSTTEFWKRWHISLNEWFVDNVYIPLGGNRKSTFRKYMNIMIVFGISGLWHGANWHFVAWGVVNGILVIIGQLMLPLKSKVCKVLRIDEEVESIVFLKRLSVFILITLTWVLFSTSIKDALEICKRIVFFDFVSIFNPTLLRVAGSEAATTITIIFVLVFCLIQFSRQSETAGYIKYTRQPFFIQCFVVSVVICVCVFAVCNTDASIDTQFIYFQF